LERELEPQDETHHMEPVSVTTHDELRVETNRYIILHVLDAVFVTQKKHYDALIKMYSYKYGEKN
jgi:hypothetical protein